MAIYGKGDFNISKIKHYLIFCLSLLISILWVFANTPPNISDILLNSTYGTNLTTENLTAYVTYYDNDSDSVTLIYDWRKNGISDAILNMPFDVNGSNENTTNLKDYTTYGNNGSLRNGTWNSSCNAFTSSGGCYEFDGIDDCIHVGNDISLRPTDAITVSAWIKNKNSNNVELVSYRQVPTPLYYILYGLKDDSVAINLNNGSANGRDYINYYNSVLSSNWSFIVLTFSRANQELKAYVNGVLQGSATSTGDYPLFYNHTGLDNLYIGCATPILRNANASIDQVIIWNRSLSANEIAMLYSNGAGAYNQAHSDATLKGDVWSVTIIANDGFKDGNSQSSNNLTIRSNPNMTSISLTPTTPNITSILNCTFIIADADINDVLIANVSWFNNSIISLSYSLEIINGTQKSTYLASGNISRFENWTCSILPFDGIGYGVSNNISVLIQDAWPILTSVILNSTYGTNLTTENLTSYAIYNDLENDNITLIYDWRKNGISDAILNMPFDVNGSNENTTNIKDYTTYGNNGSLINNETNPGAYWNSTCNAFTSSGGCYEFDGIDDCIHVGNDTSLRPTNAITVSAWIKNKDPNNVELVSYRQVPTPSDYILYGLRDDRVVINLANGSANGIDYNKYYNSVLSSNWSFVVLTFSRANQELKAYVNGVLQGSATSTGDYPLFYNHTGLDNLYIGCATPILRNANASIDQVIIWNRSLSANEIVMLYSNGAGAYNQAHSDATLKGDVWSVTIIANDGFKDGLPLSSNNLSIILTNISINLNLPSNGTIEKSNRRITNNTITFKCSVTNDVNLVNVSLYHNNTGTWHLNITKNVSGTSYKFLESINGISENNFIWNCYACDIDGVCGFSSANYSLIINNTKVDIIPDPQTFTYNINSSFILNNSWQIIYDSNLEYIANTLEILNNSISETLNLSLEQKNKIEFINNYTNISNHSDSNIFLMLYNDSLIGDYFLAEDSQLFNYSLHIGNKGFNQGYLLFSYNNQIFILGNSSQGIYYGMQSLRQIFEDWSNSLYDFNIIDWPDIEYRIFYYVTSENGDDPTIGLQYLENLSRFKMNGVQFSFSGVFAYTKLDTVFIPYTNYSLKNFIRPILTPVWLAQVENGTEGNAIINESFTFNSSNIAVPNLIENNLFYNLDFENGSVGNRPDNWTNISNSIINGQWLITDQANFSGNQSLMLIRNSSSGSASPEMQQTANVSENSYYLVRFKVKTENSSGSGYYQFNLDRLDINSTIIYYDYLQYSADDDGEWHTINIHVAKHSDVRKLRIRMRPVNIYGTIYVDNLNFFRMNAEMINVLTEGGHIFKVTDLLGTTTYVKDRDYTLNKSGSVMATRADTQNITNRVSVNRLPSGNIGINETVLISYDFIFELTASTWQTINPYVNYSFDYVKEFFRNVSKEFNNSGFSSDKFDISLGQDERRGINVDSRSLAQNKENYVTMYLTLNKLYDSCKEIYPYSKIFFWGDMLINYDNGGDIDYQVRWGGKSGATYYASYLLNKSMIIIPWYYHSTDGLKVMRESANFFNNMGIRIAGGAGGNETNIKYWSAMLNNNTLNSYFYGHSVFYAPFSKGETIKYLAEYSWNNYGGDISDLSADNNYELCNGFDDDDDGSIDEDYNLSNDPNHCGTCGNICSYTNALSSCSNGNCQFDACYGDYYNIDNSEINGCEYFCILTNNAVEISDNLDNNCDGSIDEGLMVATLTPTPGTEELLGGSLKNLLPRVSHSILKVLKNTPVYFDFRNKTVVGKIIIITNKDLENVKIEVKEKDSVSNEYSKEVYKYFEIITYQITDDDIVEAEIEFDVEKTWLENNSEAANILLLRYTDSWNELETSLVSEDDNKYYFKAKTPGFSDFAISFKEQEVIEEQEEVVNQKEEVKEEVIEEVKPIIEEKSYTLWYVLGALVLLGVVGLIVFLILRKE